jgi:hypothetical protein
MVPITGMCIWSPSQPSEHQPKVTVVLDAAMDDSDRAANAR